MTALAPIALFVYNRPLHTRRTVDALKKNAESAESELIIFSDAAKSEIQAPAVNEIRQYIRKIEGFKSVTIIERESNYGLARSIIDGVTSVVNKYGRIIVLEDDLITSPNFLAYMNRGLEEYENEKQVMQISGYIFPVDIKSEEDALFLPMVTSWGWATWQRAWQHFDPAASGHLQLKHNRARRKAFDLEGSFPYFKMLESQICGKIDSWAIRWWLSVFLRNGLVLYPRLSLVENIGFDGSGTHRVSSHVNQMKLLTTGFHMNLPAVITVKNEHKQTVYNYLSQSGERAVDRLVRRYRRLVRLLIST